MKKLIQLVLLVLSLGFISVTVPIDWTPKQFQKYYYEWVGPSGYVSAPDSVPDKRVEVEEICPPDHKGWRPGQTIEGVNISPSAACLSDNPHAVAAFVKGTNNVSHMTLMESKLAPDAVVKDTDLDGDGDPDIIHIRLEVMELNGGSPDLAASITSFDIAPGIQPGFWVFAPKTFGMSTENFESLKASPMLRAPSPVIRVEQGDQIKITLENTHYMPHTIHLHGVDHPFVDADGNGNDGVPQTSEMPLMPGKSRTYDINPRQTGTMFYHCHVQPQIHIMMGLQGMFVVEENKPNNWLQTLNIGAGQVRHKSVAINEKYDAEYDLHYQTVDKELHELIQDTNDARLTVKDMHRNYDITDSSVDYFLLNGRSFPYTIQESVVTAKPDQLIKFRVLNGGSEGISLHTHGHKFAITHYDGIGVAPIAQITRDVVWVAPAQRVDLDIDTTNDGLHSYGEGAWIFHDHVETAVTNDGISPGGSVSAIVYEKYMTEGGMPRGLGVDWNKFFSPEYYARKIPVWSSYDPLGLFADVEPNSQWIVKLISLGVALGVFLLSLLGLLRRSK